MGLQWEGLAGLVLWEQCTLLLLEEVLLVAMGLQEDSVLDVLELDALDWEAVAVAHPVAHAVRPVVHAAPVVHAGHAIATPVATSDKLRADQQKTFIDMLTSIL